MEKLYNFDQFNRLYESQYPDLTNIIIGDSLTPLIAKNSIDVDMLGPVGSEANLWKSGVNTEWLKKAVEKFPTTPAVKNVVIKIGTNSGFSLRDDVRGLFVALRRAFPSAKFFVVQGSWGWGNNKNVTKDNVKKYYDLYAKEGATVIEPPVGYFATSAQAHKESPAVKQIAKNLDIAIQESVGGAIVATPEIKDSEIIIRKGDPYKYKVVNDHWLAKRDDQSKWYEITGKDFKPGYQVSINILDTENPMLRTPDSPKRENRIKGDQTAVNPNIDTTDVALDPLLLGKFPIKLSGSYKVPNLMIAKGDALHSFDRRKIDGFGGYMLRGGPIPSKWASHVKLDQDKGINQVLSDLISSGIKPDVTNISIKVNPDYSVNWEATIDQSKDGQAYSGVASRGSAGRNADERALEQISKMKSQKPNAHNWKEVLDLNIENPIKIRQYFMKYSEN
jgi:hypothetical protein